MCEETNVVHEIQVFEMSGEAPYNTSFLQGQLADDIIENNGEEKWRQRTSLSYAY